MKIVLFQAIQFRISAQISSILPIESTLSGATTPGQSWPDSDISKGVLHIPQSSSITGISPSDCIMSYTGHSSGGGLTLLYRCSLCILQPQPTEQGLNRSVWQLFVFEQIPYNYKLFVLKTVARTLILYWGLNLLTWIHMTNEKWMIINK